MFVPEFPISTLSLCENHTPAALSCQVQVDIAALGSYRGPFGLHKQVFATSLCRARVAPGLPPYLFMRKSGPKSIMLDSFFFEARRQARFSAAKQGGGIIGPQ